MFSLNVTRFFFICDKIIIRNIRGKRPVLSNPGVDNRLKAFQEDGIKVQGNEVEEYIEQSESSFYDVGEAYNEHLNETLIGKHELRHHIVKERYFKENMPNLITWSEKEQIRHLATTQPEEWTLERIAESFPVTKQVAKKLLKYPWKPATEERIARHDASAMRNWKELKEGNLNISDDIREHFLKFSERVIPPLNRKSIKIDVSQQKIGEFEQIVRRCASDSNRQDKENVNDDSNKKFTSEANKTYKTDYKKVTLDELASKIKTRLDHGQNVDLPDRMIADSLETVRSDRENMPVVSKSEIEIITEKQENSDVTSFKENDNKLQVVDYPERIRIPKQVHKMGATYKMNDCFYDHDGRFLYRVIGMTDVKQ